MGYELPGRLLFIYSRDRGLQGMAFYSKWHVSERGKEAFSFLKYFKY